MTMTRKRYSRPLGGTSAERDEPDWDYHYVPPNSNIERDRSNAVERDRSSVSTAGESHWNYNNDSIVAPPTLQQSSSSFSDSPPRQRATRRLSNLEVLCATHEYSPAQQPESLYYKTVSTRRNQTRSLPLQPPPPAAGKHRVVPPRDQGTPNISAMRKSMETNDVRRSMEQSLMDRAESRRKEKGGEDVVPITEISFERHDESSMPPGCRLPSFRGSNNGNKNSESADRTAERKPRKTPARKDDAAIPPISEITIEREESSPGQASTRSIQPSTTSKVAARQKNLVDNSEGSSPLIQPTLRIKAATPSSITIERQAELSPPPTCDLPSTADLEKLIIGSRDVSPKQGITNGRPSVISFVPQAEDLAPPKCELPSFIGPYFASPSIELPPNVASPSIEASTDSTASSRKNPAAVSTSRSPPPPSATLSQRRPPQPKVPVMDLPPPPSKPSTDVPPTPSPDVPVPHTSSTGSSSEERISPTSITDIVEELSDLQEQLDALRMTKPGITKEAFVDAAYQAKHEELVDFPELISEELIDGVPFQAFESGRDVPDAAVSKASTFSAFVDALHTYEPPAMEESFVDEGVRVRRFGEEGDSPNTPDSSFSISIQEVQPRKEKVKAPESEDRDSPEPFQEEPVKKKQVSKKRQSKTKSQVVESPRRKLMSIRGALASVRGRSSASSSQDTPVKAVRFSKNLVTSMHYRPKTLPHEMDLLYFSSAELEELERDRDERIYEEQFEVVAGPDFQDVAVTYPVRRKQKPIESEMRRTRPRVEKKAPSSPPVPGLLDISDISSWSSSSEAEQQKQQQQKSFEI